jgi:hypothetical protein
MLLFEGRRFWNFKASSPCSPMFLSDSGFSGRGTYYGFARSKTGLTVCVRTIASRSSGPMRKITTSVASMTLPRGSNQKVKRPPIVGAKLLSEL